MVKEEVVEVINPKFIPYHHNIFIQKINRALIHKQVKPLLTEKDDVAIWVSNPAAEYLCDGID